VDFAAPGMDAKSDGVHDDEERATTEEKASDDAKVS
jgi:uncharacterized membrane protein YebE (DUF533 family)